MKRFRLIVALATILSGMSSTANAQFTYDGQEYQSAPYMFVGVQGGFQTTFTRNYDCSKLITPTASVSFGAFFTPVVGARLHVNGAWNKGGVQGFDMMGNEYNAKYEYKYITTNVDLMLNLVTMFGNYDHYPVNLYLIGGMGLNTAWANDDACQLASVLPDLTNGDGLGLAWKGTKMHHNFRVGLMLDVDLTKNISFNMEASANSVGDRFNSKLTNCDDWQLTAQVGLAFKFGYKKIKKAVVEKPVIAPVTEAVVEHKPDTIWYDDITYRDITEQRDLKKEIFFDIRMHHVTATTPQIVEVAKFVKEVQNPEVTIAAYADKGTGTPKGNLKYSQKRADQTRAVLIEAGVDPSVIKSCEGFGDAVQPYAENDKNRLVVITARGTTTRQEKVVTKKFRVQ